MSNNIVYDSYVVQQGGSEGTPNTLLTIADSEEMDVSILQRLNPNYDAKAVLSAGTKILTGIGSLTDKIDGFVTSTYKVYLSKDNKLYGRYTENITYKRPEGATSKDVMLEQINPTHNPTVSKITLTSLAKMLNSDGYQYPFTIDLDTLVKLNPNMDQGANLKAGDVILLAVTAPGVGTTVTIEEFGIQVDTTRTLFVSWYWNHIANSKTEKYDLEWQWQASNGRWMSAGKVSTSDAETKQSTYSPDEKAIAVRVRVKPVNKNLTSSYNKKDDYKWTDWIEYRFEYSAVITPTAPNVEINNYKLTASLDGISNEANNIDSVQFEIVQDHDISTAKRSALLPLSTGHVSYVCNITAGHNYKVRARCYNAICNIYSSWSDYSSVSNTLPIAPDMYRCNILANKTVQFSWLKVHSADEYELQYILKNPDIYNDYRSDEMYFESASSYRTSIRIKAADAEDDGTIIIHNVPEIPFGDYLARVKAINETESEWSNIVKFVLGKKPESPTTWSSTTTVSVGEPLKLYWIHNSEDGSQETFAQVRLTVDGVVKPIITIPKSTDENKKDETSYYVIDTNIYNSGSTIDWEVSTAGVLTDQNGKHEFGDWSIKRTVKIYAPPTLQVQVLDYEKNILDERLETFPFYIQMTPGNTNNQTPVGYHVSVIAKNDYETADQLGNDIAVAAGSKVFSKYYDIKTSKPEPIKLTPKDLSLEVSQTYSVVCSVAMSSGLTAEDESAPFYVSWNSRTYYPTAEVGLDKDSLTTIIRPYCPGANDSVTLHVYRREFDGTFTPIIEEGDEDDPNDGMENNGQTFVTDPHPSLDYARYRIVARDKLTGAISYNDIPSYPILEKSVVIQWDEAWQSFDAIDDEEDYMVDKPWSGSIIKIPYNIDISNSHSPDVSLVRYIGRKRPVSYYGTQLGETATWNMVIPKSDKETLYALRRLAVYMGNVYVREPSGSGYWASINISFNQTHLDVTIPVTINVTPVEGGM